MIEFPVSRGTLGYCPREHHPTKNRDSESLAITAWRHRDLPTHLTRPSLCPACHNNPVYHTLLTISYLSPHTLPPLSSPSLPLTFHTMPYTIYLPQPFLCTLSTTFYPYYTLPTTSYPSHPIYPTHSTHHKPSSTSP